jgi:hypothetical protein
MGIHRVEVVASWVAGAHTLLYHAVSSVAMSLVGMLERMDDVDVRLKRPLGDVIT